MYSFITVAYNSLDEIERLHTSLVDAGLYPDSEFIVVDNYRCSNLKNFCEKNGIIYIKNKTNSGFAIANNMGARCSSRDWLFFINPDTKIDAISKYIVLDENSMYLPYIRELSEFDGDEYSCRKNIIPTLPNIFKAFLHREMATSWYRGSALLLNRKIYNFLGGWPEDYFMYCEDLDFFYIALNKNVEIKRVPVFVTHAGHQSTKKSFSNSEREMLIIRSLQIFYRKHRLWYSYFFAYPFLMIKSLFKNPFSSVKNISGYYVEIIKGFLK